MNSAEILIQESDVNPQWHSILSESLVCVDTAYLHSLVGDDSWLPGAKQIFGSFRRDLADVQYLLIGESPYPRRESANGIAFYDAAVDELWSASGLSKPVNRATSMRNIIKTMLLAEQRLQQDKQGRLGQAAIAALDKDDMIQTMPELFANLQAAGFLLLNATPVLHPQRKPAQEATFWQHFLERLLLLLAQESQHRITLLLWGKIAQSLGSIDAVAGYDKIACEHPYNISFIDNPAMRQLFGRLRILQRPVSKLIV